MHAKKEERYERILAESARLFAEKGYEQTTISDVVKACDMARGTFYLYFESLEQVLSALFSDMMNLIGEEVQRILQQGAGEVRDIVRAMFHLVTERKDLFTVFHSGGGQTFYKFKYQRYRETLGVSVTELIRKGQEAGRVRPCSPELVAMMITSLIDQVAYYALVLKPDAHTQEQVIEELVTFIMAGIRKQ